MLFSIYGDSLSKLFQTILGIPFASSTEVLIYLDQLRSDSSSTMQKIIAVYQYLQKFCETT